MRSHPSDHGKPFLKPFFALSCIALIVSCAHQVSPGGGPEDKAGPTVLVSEPLPGAVNVDPASRIAFTFSEWISRTAAPRSVSILPPVEGGVKVRVSGRRLEITPAHALADSTTYHVVITAQLMDLRNNPVASSFTLVFSTGPTLDSGRVAGCIIDPAVQRSMAVVALYRVRDTLADSALFGEPEYLTQTDSAAFFSFENVRAGRYRLVGFADQNNNRRLDPGKEAAFAPVSYDLNVENRPDTILLFPVSSDTASPRIAAVTVMSPSLLLGSLTKPVDTSIILEWKVEQTDKKGAAVNVLSTERMGKSGTRYLLPLADSLTRSPYRLLLRLERRAEGSGPIVRDTMRFNGGRPLDTVRPAVVSVAPTAPMVQEGTIELHFSEPVAVTAPLILVDSLLDTVRLALDSGFCDTVVGRPERRLRAGSTYRMVLLSSFGKDLAGNPLKVRDTTDTVLTPRFSVIDPESLAVSLKGCVSCLPADSLRRWQFLPFSKGTTPYAKDSGGCFSFDSIPAGKGFLAQFSDVNRNGIPDQGTLVPWSPSEAYQVFPDTVEARARWEVEGVAPQQGCVRCKKHVPAVAPAHASPAK